jgi:hypothetical protein
MSISCRYPPFILEQRDLASNVNLLGVIAVNVETPAIAGAALEYGFFAPVSVYLDDLDFMGMLHNSRFTVLAERAFVAYWQTLRPCQWSDEARRVNEKLLRPATD